MKAGTWFIDIPILKGINYRHNVDKFTNAISSLSGVVEFEIFTSTLEKFSQIQKLLKIDEEAKISFGNDNYKFPVMFGIIENLSYSCGDLEYSFKVGLVFRTFRFQQIKTKLYDHYSEKISREAIKNLFKINNCDKLYENIIFPQKLQDKDGRQIDMQIYSTNKSVFEILEMFVNDLQVRIFTTMFKGKTTLYFYDTGVIIDSVKKDTQNIRDDNFINFRFNIRGSKIFDKVSIEILEGASTGLIDFKTIGVPAELKKNSSAKNISNSKKTDFSHLKSKRLNLPDIVFTRTLKTTSEQQDLGDYKDYLIKSSLDDGLVIEANVNSLFIDIKKPEKGIWEIGSEIKIEARVLKEVLKIDFQKYLLASKEYFFILKGTDCSSSEKGIQVKLYISLSDLHRTK